MHEKTPQASVGSRHKRRKGFFILGGVSAIVIVIVCFFAVKAYIEAPRDLGSDLVYIGRFNSGNVLGFDQLPGANYFFATAMNINQIDDYLSKAHYIFDPLEGAGDDTGGYAVLTFKKNNDIHDITLYYFDSRSLVESKYGISLTDRPKAHIVEVADYDYSSLRQALQGAGLLGK